MSPLPREQAPAGEHQLVFSELNQANTTHALVKLATQHGQVAALSPAPIVTNPTDEHFPDHTSDTLQYLHFTEGFTALAFTLFPYHTSDTLQY